MFRFVRPELYPKLLTSRGLARGAHESNAQGNRYASVQSPAQDWERTEDSAATEELTSRVGSAHRERTSDASNRPSTITSFSTPPCEFFVRLKTPHASTPKEQFVHSGPNDSWRLLPMGTRHTIAMRFGVRDPRWLLANIALFAIVA